MICIAQNKITYYINLALPHCRNKKRAHAMQHIYVIRYAILLHA